MALQRVNRRTILRGFACLSWMTLLAGAPATSNAAKDLLDPQVAFSLSGQMSAPDQVVLRFHVADGYYLYRDKLRVSIVADPAIAAQPNFPKGKIKQDEFFGRVEIYRGDLMIPVALSAATSNETLTVKVISQGCADVGVCYPPQEQSLVVGPKLGVVEAAPRKHSTGRSLLDKLR